MPSQPIVNVTDRVFQMMRMDDAEFPSNEEGFTGPIAGYFGGPQAANVWSPPSWRLFKNNPKLPIWVGGWGGHEEGIQAVQALKFLGFPVGCVIANDMENRIDRTYLEAFDDVLSANGFKVWVYGSASTVFNNPPLNGYWVADYAGIGPFMYDHDSVRATQYQPGPKVDYSVVKPWAVERQFWH